MWTQDYREFIFQRKLDGKDSRFSHGCAENKTLCMTETQVLCDAAPCNVVENTDVSEVCTAFIIRAVSESSVKTCSRKPHHAKRSDTRFPDAIIRKSGVD